MDIQDELRPAGKIYDMEEDLLSGKQALKVLKETRFDDKSAGKKNFDVLYKIFRRFKDGIVKSNDGPVLPEYLDLMTDIV